MRNEYHHLYNTAAWRKARIAFLSANPLCRMHGELGKMMVANIVDHIKPHKGDLSLFWDQGNWQALCKHCHDSHKHAQETSGLLRGAGLDGIPLDRNHPWHAAPEPVRAVVGGGEKSGANDLQTVRFPSFAKPRNGQGGLS